jgi:hypothetical protein
MRSLIVFSRDHDVDGIDDDLALADAFPQEARRPLVLVQGEQERP